MDLNKVRGLLPSNITSVKVDTGATNATNNPAALRKSTFDAFRSDYDDTGTMTNTFAGDMADTLSLPIPIHVTTLSNMVNKARAGNDLAKAATEVPSIISMITRLLSSLINH